MNEADVSDVVIVISVKDTAVLTEYISYFLKNLNTQKIVVIGNRAVQYAISHIEHTRFIDEDMLYSGMTFEAVRIILEELNPRAVGRTGWYFQQFLKMAYCFVTSQKHYLVWDGDTIPLRKLGFYDSQEGRYLFNLKSEFNKPYFDTLEKLFVPVITKQIDRSFISEHMMINTDIMKNLIADIESNQQLKGNSFYEKILRAVDPKNLPVSGFSEYETYGSYMLQHYSAIMKFRNFTTMRHGGMFFGANPTSSDIEWAAKSFDTISFEKYDRRWGILCFSKSKRYREKHEMQQLAAFFENFIYAYSTVRLIVRSILRRRFPVKKEYLICRH